MENIWFNSAPVIVHDI